MRGHGGPGRKGSAQETAATEELLVVTSGEPRKSGDVERSTLGRGTYWKAGQGVSFLRESLPRAEYTSWYPQGTGQPPTFIITDGDTFTPILPHGGGSAPAARAACRSIRPEGWEELDAGCSCAQRGDGGEAA